MKSTSRSKSPTKKSTVRSRKKTVGAPNWQVLSGGGGGTYDAFHSRPEPRAFELVNAFDDIVYACVTLIAQKIATTKIKLYAKREPGERRPKLFGGRMDKVDYRTRHQLVSDKRFAHVTEINEV